MKPNILSKLLHRRTDPLDLLTRLTTKRSQLNTLVHVGAHLAQERFAYEAAGYRRILWIEGSPKVYERLARDIAEHQRTLTERGAAVRHQTLCALLIDRPGETLDLREYSNDGMSSSIFAVGEESLRRWPDVVETGFCEHLVTDTLDNVLVGLGLRDSVDTLVVDVQGAELLVLKGAEQCLRNASAVISEVSSRAYYHGGVLYGDLRAFLSERGFVAMSTPRRHGDMLFVRQSYLDS